MKDCNVSSSTLAESLKNMTKGNDKVERVIRVSARF